MKIAALLLLILGALLIAGLGLLLLLMSVMAVGTPGPVRNPGGLLMVFLPFLAGIAVLVFAGAAYRSENYARSVGFGSIFGVAMVGIAVAVGSTSFGTLRDYRAAEAQAAEDARHYPIQKFLRPVAGGADTIIVFPGRIVAYRLYVAGGMPFAGPVGNLNEARTTIVVDDREFDEKIGREALSQFVDGQGRKLTDIYAIQ